MGAHGQDSHVVGFGEGFTHTKMHFDGGMHHEDAGSGPPPRSKIRSDPFELNHAIAENRRAVEHVTGMEVTCAFNLAGTRNRLLSRSVQEYRDVNDRILREVIPKCLYMKLRGKTYTTGTL
jgi:hypothetical protein